MLAGHPRQAIALSTSATPPSPSQVSTRPHCINSGTSVPEAAMPSPTPVKIAPPARPRRRGGMPGITLGAASAISTPPVPPDKKRQKKNQAKPSGNAQARRLAAVASIEPRSKAGVPVRAATARAPIAPARYPARLAAPR